MTNADSVGQNSGSANGDESQATGSGSAGDNQPKTVDWADHKRALDDMHKFKSRWRDTESQLEQMKAKLQEIDQNRLVETQNYKELADKLQKDLEATKTKEQRLKEGLIYNERFRAVFPELKKAGLRDDAHNLLEQASLDEVEVEWTDQGRIIVNNPSSFAESFKAKYPYAFEAKKAPNVNGGGGSYNAGEKMTPQRLNAIEDECKKKGDMTPYRKAFEQYVRENKK